MNKIEVLAKALFMQKKPELSLRYKDLEKCPIRLENRFFEEAERLSKSPEFLSPELLKLVGLVFLLQKGNKHESVG